MSRIPFIRGNRKPDIFHGRYAPIWQLTGTGPTGTGPTGTGPTGMWFVPTFASGPSYTTGGSLPENKGFYPHPGDPSPDLAPGETGASGVSGFPGFERDNFVKFAWRVKCWRLSGTLEFDISAWNGGSAGGGGGFARYDHAHVIYTAEAGLLPPTTGPTGTGPSGPTGWKTYYPGITGATGTNGLLLPTFISGLTTGATGHNLPVNTFALPTKEFQPLDFANPKLRQWHNHASGASGPSGVTGPWGATGPAGYYEIVPATFNNDSDSSPNLSGDPIFQPRGTFGWVYQVQVGATGATGVGTGPTGPRLLRTELTAASGAEFEDYNDPTHSLTPDPNTGIIQLSLLSHYILDDQGRGFPYASDPTYPRFFQQSNIDFARGHGAPLGFIYYTGPTGATGGTGASGTGASGTEPTEDRYFPQILFCFTANFVAYYIQRNFPGAVIYENTVPEHIQVRSYKKPIDFQLGGATGPGGTLTESGWEDFNDIQVGTLKILNTSDPGLHTGTEIPLYVNGIWGQDTFANGFGVDPTNIVASFELRPVEWWPYTTSSSSGQVVYDKWSGEPVDHPPYPGSGPTGPTGPVNPFE